jgi:uncharacterized membrane protein YccC
MMVNLKPKVVFLIDGLGAVLTALLLLAVLIPFHIYFGMPREVLVVLSGLAVVLAAYSFFCFVFSVNNWEKRLKRIVGANVVYCFLTLGSLVYFYDRLTILGVTYFLGELLVIFGLIIFEIKVLIAHKQPLKHGLPSDNRRRGAKSF